MNILSIVGIVLSALVVAVLVVWGEFTDGRENKSSGQWWSAWRRRTGS